VSELALVFGMGVSGEAVARHLRDRGARVVAADDGPGPAARERAASAGFELVEAPSGEALRALVAQADVVVPTPAIPETHPLFALAAETGTPVRGEIELAGRWTRRPIVAVTGTNGKTTVTELITAMLQGSGVDAVAAGNIGLPLADAVRRNAEVFVAEVSSFQLHSTDSFHPKVAVWLNFAADHLDWHVDMDSYAAAKARIWAYQDADDTAVVNADDPVVMKWAAGAPSRVVTFGLQAAADYFVRDGQLHGPFGPFLGVDELPRSQPHDLANSLAAAAAAWPAGASDGGIAAALRRFRGGPHRVALVAEAEGIRWYDDSKATNPHATVAAVSGFESVVLIAGGRNKGLDLRPLGVDTAPRVRAVVALGEAAPDVVDAFEGLRPVTVAATMDEAVTAAHALAQPGDVVLLSPACASYDLYRNYAERGDDFARIVRARVERAG
jgi:UDP-N-acetylmuramoylalanine--D-glutamate ligase